MVVNVFDKTIKERVVKLYNVTNIVPRDGYIEITQALKIFQPHFIQYH